MHGLIFETSIWLLAGSTRWKSVAECYCASNMFHKQCAPKNNGQAIQTHTCTSKAASYLRPWNWTKCAHHKGMEPRILPPTLFSLHLRHILWQTLCHATQQQLTASPETYTSGTHGTAGVNCKPSSPTNSNFLSILASPFVCCCSFVFEVNKVSYFKGILVGQN